MSDVRYTRSLEEPVVALTAVTATPQVLGTVTATRVIPMDGFNRLMLDVRFVRVAGTAVVFHFDTSRDGTTWTRVTSCDVAAGAGTRTGYTDTFTTSSSTNYDIKLADLDCNYLRYDVAVTSGTTDTVTIYARKTFAP